MVSGEMMEYTSKSWNPGSYEGDSVRKKGRKKDKREDKIVLFV